MKRVAGILLAGIWLALSAHSATAGERGRSQQHYRAPSATSLAALDPYLVAPNNLANIDLSAFLSGNPNFSEYDAVDLAADASSAAILLFETGSTSNVSFSITNGTATLQTYAANFMTLAPQTGAQSLTVTSSSFISANGHYYAPVLLQGPLAGYSSANAISITATQDGNSDSVNLGLVMPPLVLVHGLWGDLTSLENVEAYIDSVAPWKTQTQLVLPICYSLYLAFDATTDPLTKGKNACEVTSESALQTGINSLMAELDSEHIVGGRVDIAAHSMGGLASRNYASQSGYASLRNRMQGQIHTIVTLDTPEIGSLLANWLDGHATNKQKAPDWTPPGLIWSEVCGSNDVQVCFYNNGYPLAAPSLPLDTGGVHSLEPNGPSLTNPNLVGPNISNATWRAVSATAPGNSALAFGLNTLISALYTNPYGNNVPTLNSILQKLPNDAIVTVQSQTKGTNQTYTFSKLSHTSLVSSILTWLTGDTLNDNSVTDDPSGQVYALTACWLETSGSNACAPKEEQVTPPETAVSPALKPVDRIDVSGPTRVVLGQPFEIIVHLKTQGTAPALSVYQRGEQGRVHLEPVSVGRSDNNTVTLNVTPKLPGPVVFGIRAAFSDGGVSVRQLTANVVPPATQPLAFKANALPVLVMTMNASSDVAMAHPFAVYPAPVGRVYLNSSFVTWRLAPQKGSQVVTLQRDGLLRAVAPGTATIEARYGSSVDQMRVIVRAHQQ